VTVRRNLAANFLGSAWASLLNLVLVPVFVRYLGSEGYGLIGFYGLLTSVAGLLDAGLSAAMSRQLAVLAARGEGSVAESRALVRTIEVLIWAASAAVGTLMVVAAPFVARRWLNLEKVELEQAVWALRFMGLSFLVQWPTSLYTACLVALQRQVRLNAFATVIATVRGLGAVVVLWKVSSSVFAFFLWQLAAAVVGVAALGVAAWGTLASPGAERPRFSRQLLLDVWRFAAGVSASQILAMILVNLDKIILSKVLPLSAFGIYSLAWTLGFQLYKIVGPIMNAIYPRLVQCAAASEPQALRGIFQKGYQLISAAVVPLGLVLVVLPEHVVFAWTRDAELARQARWPTALLSLGCILNALMIPLHSLQMAFGRTGFIVRVALGVVIVAAPVTWFLAVHHGLVGAALAWPALNGSALAFHVLVALPTLVPRERSRWFANGLLVPFVASLGVLVAASRLCPPIGRLSQPVTLVVLGASYGVAALLVALVMPAMRTELASLARKFRREKAA